jgi:MYXO-CTERM domain-containing protein
MKLNKPILLLTAAVGVAATPAFAVTVLYYDDFSGLSTAALNGTTPDTTIGANTWTAKNTTNTSFRADGSIAGTSGTTAANTGSAFLSFTPTVGRIYTLEVVLSQPTGTLNSEWTGIGFSNSLTVDNSHNVNAPNGGMPWVLWRNNAAHTDTDDLEAYPGRAAFPSGGIALGDFTGTRTITIKLTTLASAWKAEWLVDGISLYTYTYTALQTDPGSLQNFDGNPTINQVSISRSRFTQPDFVSFSLTEAVPEPSAALLGGLGLLALLRRRRS